MRLLTARDLAKTIRFDTELSTIDLLNLYAVDDQTPVVRANMVVSLDGRTTGADGVSGTLSTPADRTVFALLRSLSDVIVVGAGTARAEGYRPAKVRDDLQDARKATGRTAPPVIALVSRSLRLNLDDPLFERGRCLVITDANADHAAVARTREVVDVIVTPSPEVDLVAAVEALRELGLRQVLTEGGPSLLGSMLTQGVVDELCLTVSPRILGGDGKHLLGAEHSVIDASFELAHLIESDGTVMTRYIKAST